MPDPEAARAFLVEHKIDPTEVAEAIHFADGSMSVVLQRGEDRWHWGIEFNPDFTTKVALALRAVGVPVERRDG